jgi:hypothetical protein
VDAISGAAPWAVARIYSPGRGDWVDLGSDEYALWLFLADKPDGRWTHDALSTGAGIARQSVGRVLDALMSLGLQAHESARGRLGGTWLTRITRRVLFRVRESIAGRLVRLAAMQRPEWAALARLRDGGSNREPPAGAEASQRHRPGRPAPIAAILGGDAWGGDRPPGRSGVGDRAWSATSPPDARAGGDGPRPGDPGSDPMTRCGRDDDPTEHDR